MNIEQRIREHIATAEVMQLATVKDGQPWACTVHFIADDDLNIYWFSLPERRHSQDIAANPRAAVAMAIKTTWPVIGVQIEGDAAPVTDAAEIERVARQFADRHARGEKFVLGVLAGTEENKPYRLTPRMIQIFDKQNYPDKPEQVWQATTE